MVHRDETKPLAFVEINGRRYDLLKGTVFAAPQPLISDVVPAVQAAVDLTPPPVINSQPLRRQVMDIQAPRNVYYVQPHQVQTTQTLMRNLVAKPMPVGKHRLRAVTRTDILAKTPREIVVVPKLSVMTIDPRRKQVAQRVPRSVYVQHFAPTKVTIAVTQNRMLSPEAIADVRAFIQPADATSPSLDVFERALRQADAHLEKPVNQKKLAKQAKRHTKHTTKKTRRHMPLSTAAVSLACLLLLGLLTYQNRTAITLRYASAKAGFHVSLPSYRPAGFAISKFDYQLGSVSTAFNNRSSQQSFILTQQRAYGDGTALLAQLAASSRDAVQTLQHNGQMILVDSRNNNATWVNNNVLYRLQSNGSLSTSQVVNLASSLAG